MKRYVLCYAHKLPHYHTNEIILIERKKDDWQKGKLNLPGGSIHDGETPEEAAFRELREETGLYASLADIRVVGEIVGNTDEAESAWSVVVCFCPYRAMHGQFPQEAKTLTAEGDIHTMDWRDAIHDPRLIPNLKLIVPYCQSRLTGWRLVRCADEYTWVTTLPKD